MVSGWSCVDCHRTFKSIETLNRHNCKPAKGNCEKLKGEKDCTNPICRYASFPNQKDTFDSGVPHCNKPGSFDRIYHKQSLCVDETKGEKCC
jgi:hypothetical protein